MTRIEVSTRNTVTFEGLVFSPDTISNGIMETSIMQMGLMMHGGDDEGEMVHEDPMAGPTGQAIVKFDNGYGASVVRHAYSYGGSRGLYELAVLDSDGDLTYSTPVTSDVLGFLTKADVAAALVEIAALSPATKQLNP